MHITDSFVVFLLLMCLQAVIAGNILSAKLSGHVLLCILVCAVWLVVQVLIITAIPPCLASLGQS